MSASPMDSDDPAAQQTLASLPIPTFGDPLRLLRGWRRRGVKTRVETATRTGAQS